MKSFISSFVFPHPWKCASIKPLHKGGVRVTPSSYRPISLRPACSKLLERCINEQLTSHLHSNNLVHLLQSGFHPQHSKQTPLLHCMYSWYKALDIENSLLVLFSLTSPKPLILLTMTSSLSNPLILACLPLLFLGFSLIFLQLLFTWLPILWCPTRFNSWSYPIFCIHQNTSPRFHCPFHWWHFHLHH